MTEGQAASADEMADNEQSSCSRYRISSCKWHEHFLLHM